MRLIQCICFISVISVIGLASAFHALALEDSDATVSLEQFWIEAEAKDADDAFGAWQEIYERHIAGEPLPSGISHDVLILNIVHSALSKHNFAIAEEFSELLRDKQHLMFTRLYVKRAEALKKASSAKKVRKALLALLPEAKETLEGDVFYNWVGALSTALLDVADKNNDEDTISHVEALLELQKTGRHRAYMLHRLALLENGGGKEKLDEIALQAAFSKNDIKEAYGILARAALSKKNKARNNWLMKLHEKARKKEKYSKIALRALWLIDSNSKQINALIDYIDWLIERQEISKATQVAQSVEAGNSAIRAYRRLAKQFKTLKMDYFHQQYQQRITKHESNIGKGELLPELRVPYDPFKKLSHDKVLFDVPERAKALQSGDFPEASRMCFAPELQGEIGKPIKGFKTTADYGADRRAHQFSWTIMVHAGRSLAGDGAATRNLKKILLSWADANAFAQSEVTHNAYFSLKRVLYPTIISFSAIQPTLTKAERKKIITWLDPIVRAMDKKFGGKVDVNNHRFMADAALMAWGVIVEDPKLYYKGMERFSLVLHEMHRDGSLPLETRRGNRATWYMRQSLASLMVMAEMARVQGDNLYGKEVHGKRFGDMVSFFMNSARNPLIVFPYATENLTPGHEYNVFKQDVGMLETRGHGRHYMAFAESWLSHEKGFVANRLEAFLKHQVKGQRPFIDEFSGGNVSCFWWSK